MKLHDRLKEYKKINNYPLHMPGHKGRFNYSDVDFTEIEGLDDLHNPKEDILELINEISRIYNSKKSFISTNGSTGAILAAISVVREFYDKILVGRQVHKSVHNAIHINRLLPFFTYPKIDESGIVVDYDYEEIEIILKENDIHAMIFTTPTYEGVILNKIRLREIADKYNAILILDEAHGAHIFENNIADISVQSLHKTLPAMTSSAIVHCNNEKLEPYLQMYLSMYITSSPSYVILDSISKCIDFIKNNREVLKKSLEKITGIREKLKKLKYLHLFDSDDVYKIVISTVFCNINAITLFNLIKNRGFMLEMNTDKYILAITTICDDWDRVEKFADILLEIDSKLKYEKDEFIFKFRRLKYEYSDSLVYEEVDIKNALKRVSRELIYLYPPGVALICRGEVFDEQIIADINYYNKLGLLDVKKVKVKPLN